MPVAAVVKPAVILDVFDSRGVRCVSWLFTKRERTAEGVEIKAADLMLMLDGPQLGYDCTRALDYLRRPST